jgi:cell wall-associated NlpC family hydrolase
MKKQLLSLILSSSLIAGGAAAFPVQAFAQSEQTAQVVSSVTFRDQPSLSGNKIRFLKAGETVTVLDKINEYWYKVRDEKGTIGYVSSNSKYLTTSYREPAQPELPKGEAVQKVIAAGMKYLGTPYEFGSSRSNTDTFDCSDFVRQAYIDGIGLKLPADSRSQGAYVKKKGNITTDWRQLKPGDIMFFMEYKGSKASNYEGVDKLSERITHNGIYIGGGKILQTYSKKSGGVRIDSIEGTQWEKRFLFGGSPL